MKTTATSINFRSCKKNDLEKLQPMIDELYAIWITDSTRNPDMMLTYEEFNKRPEKGRIVVFQDNDSLVGYAILVFYWSNQYGGDIIEIDEMFISTKHRGTGIVAEFFHWVESTYPKSTGLATQIAKYNPRMKKACQTFGFEPSADHHFFKIKSI